MKGKIHEYHGGITKELTDLGFAPGSIVDFDQIPKLLSEQRYRIALFPPAVGDKDQIATISVTQHTSFSAR